MKFPDARIPIQIMWSFADATETITDSDGKFYLERNWSFTPWILTAKVKLSNLYVFKPGYDSHPPYMYRRWTKEDEKKRNITKGAYQRKHTKYCKPDMECIIEMTPTKTEIERSAAYAGANIGGLPVKIKSKIRKYIIAVNKEGNELSFKNWFNGAYQ